MKTRWTVLVMVAFLVLAAGLDGVAAQTKWKGVATSRPTPQFALWEWFAAELDKRTGGQIKGDVVSLPELGLTGFELVRVTRQGFERLHSVPRGFFRAPEHTGRLGFLPDSIV